MSGDVPPTKMNNFWITNPIFDTPEAQTHEMNIFTKSLYRLQAGMELSRPILLPALDQHQKSMSGNSEERDPDYKRE